MERFYVDKTDQGFVIWDSKRNEPIETFDEQNKAEFYCKQQNANYLRVLNKLQNTSQGVGQP